MQHAYNPVDWFPWGDEAFQKSKSENKPILLSIGYTACHWCHVMEKESFENVLTAKIMNQSFVCIKVDREERPDLDQIYQNVAQILTRSGGWPLTVFLTPDKTPFFGGTYFPPENRFGRPEFPQLLHSISEAWKNQRNDILENEHQLMHAMRSLETIELQENERPTKEKLIEIRNKIYNYGDFENGGFGDHPKFPQTSSLTFLLRFGISTDDSEAIEFVRKSLVKMSWGGIHDQIGGGFHRYSVDATWTIPHFEKMLYDNALLLKLYSEFLLNVESDLETTSLFTCTVENIVQFLKRDLLSKDGVFFSSYDADSNTPEGESEEGYYYTWDENEFSQILTKDELNLFKKYFQILPHGNFENGKTNLQVQMSLSECAHQLNISIDVLHSTLREAKLKCLNFRKNRPKPTLDDKILIAWNALAISGLSWASRALEKYHSIEWSENAKNLALNAYKFIKSQCCNSEYKLITVYKEGQKKGPGFLDEYAFMANAALELSRVVDSNFSEELILDSENWNKIIIDQFQSNDHTYYFTPNDHEELILRPKTIWDQSMPSGMAITIQNQLILSELQSNSNYLSMADKSIFTLFPKCIDYPTGCAELAIAALMFKCGVITHSTKLKLNHPFVFYKKNESLVYCQKLSCHQITSNFQSDYIKLLKL